LALSKTGESLLLHLLRDPDSSLRQLASSVYHGVVSDEVAKRLRRLLRDRAKGVRIAAAAALSRCPPRNERTVVSGLLRAVNEDPSPEVRVIAAEGLGGRDWGKFDLWGALASALGSAEKALRREEEACAAAPTLLLEEDVEDARAVVKSLKDAISRLGNGDDK
jgi:hypothetical protein